MQNFLKEFVSLEMKVFPCYLPDRRLKTLGVMAIVLLMVSCTGANGKDDAAETFARDASIAKEEIEDRIIEAVSEHVGNALKYGRDRWSGRGEALYADGLNLNTFAPPVWKFRGNEHYINNFASQQNFMRTLVALAKVTGDEKYRQTAAEATRYMLQEFQLESGLLPWGGHQFLDLKTLQTVTGIDSDGHELKRHFPYYGLMFETDPDRATKLVRGIWDSHMRDWTDLFYHSRHGFPSGNPITEKVWDRPFHDPEPHQKIPRVGAMVHTSYDLIFAAAHLYHYMNETEAITWAMRKADMWYKARNPDTGLGSYYYHMEPTHFPGTDDNRGYEWPPFDKYGEAAVSSRFWARPGWPKTVYVHATVAKFKLAKLLGDEAGSRFFYLAESALSAFARSDAYNYDTNRINRLLTDGRVVEDDFADADLDYFYAFCLGYSVSGNEQLWPIIRSIGLAHGFGDIGEQPGSRPLLDFGMDSADAESLLAFLELFKRLDRSEYLQMAIQIADNMLDKHFHYGFFLKSEKHSYVNFDDPIPYALLVLAAKIQGISDEMPIYPHGSPSLQGRYDGEGSTSDHRIIYSETTDIDELTRSGFSVLHSLKDQRDQLVRKHGDEYDLLVNDLATSLNDENTMYHLLRELVIDALMMISVK